MAVDAFLASTRDASVQQSSSGTDTVAANVRLRWECQPGSELFIVSCLQTLDIAFQVTYRHAIRSGPARCTEGGKNWR